MDAETQPAEAPGAARRRRSVLRIDLLALAAFGLVFAAVRLNRTAAFDVAIALRIQGRRRRTLGRVMTAISWPGFPPQSRMIPPAMIAGLWRRRLRLEAAFQAAAWATALFSTALKGVTQRPRPLAPQVRVAVAQLGGSSFPSGHVLTYVGVYGFAAHLANGLIRPAAVRRAVVGGLVGLVAAIGPSRIYQGHHWPTDVLASYFLGISYLVGLAALYDRLKRGQLER
jgi:membrane-associated phospholipid phosphatase